MVALAACGASGTPATPREAPAWIAATVVEPKLGITADAPEPDASDDDVADDTPLSQGPLPPGCTPEEGKLRRAELDAIDTLVHRKDAVPADALAALRAALVKPCLAHVAPLMHVPDATTIELLRDGWEGSDDTLAEATVSLHTWRAKHQLIVPRDIAPALPAATIAELAWLACPPNDTRCDRVRSYIERAELAFDTRHEAQLAGTGVTESDWGGSVRHVIASHCASARPYTDDGDQIEQPPSWESWTRCVGARAARNKRFALKQFRAIDRGWLVLRGRRGHYQAADEIRAYDLATGAAYIVQYQSGVMMLPEQVKLNEGGPQGTTGRVAPDQLREIAFLLAARKAIVEVRTSTFYADIPFTVPRQLAPGSFTGTFGRTTWSSSDQTTIHVTYLDGATRKTGSLIWPSAADWLDDHVAELVRIMESGLVKGCAPAKLPPAAQLAGPAGKVSPIDDDERRVREYYAKLETGLDKLRANACPGAR